MEIKHITRLTWDDLPSMEIPFFARSAIERDYAAAPSGFYRIIGLGEALRDYARWYSPYGSQTDSRDALKWLLDRVDSGEYVLIRTDSSWSAPMDSVLRWSTEDNRSGHRVPRPGDKAVDRPEGCWVADPDLPALMYLEINECLEKARRSDKLECRAPEPQWWGGLLDGRRWRGGKADAPEVDGPRLSSAKKQPPVKDKPPFELKIKIIEFIWDSDIKAARENQTIVGPHWKEGTSATIPEEEKQEIQHHSTGSKKPGVYLFKGKGEDTAEAKINIHLVDPEGELTGKKYKLRCSLGGLTMQSTTSFVMASGDKKLTMKLDLPDALMHVEGDATFEAVPDGHSRGSESIENTPRLEAFVIYGKPMSFYKNGVWVEAMRLMFKKAGVAGLKRPDEISAKVTGYCHSEHGMTYDTVEGAPKFGVNGLGGDFELLKYIMKTGKSNKLSTVVNCYDQAAAVQVFSGCLGVEVKWKFQFPFGYIKTTNLIGVGSCNNPFYMSNGTKPIVTDDDPKRTGFGNHAFVETNTNAYIRDACAGPHNTTKDLRAYLDASIDTHRTAKEMGLNSSSDYLRHLLTTTRTTAGVTSVS